MQRWVRGVAALVGQARNGAVAAAVSDALHWRQSGTVTWPRTRAAFRVVERLRTARISQLASSSVQMLISNFRSTRLTIKYKFHYWIIKWFRRLVSLASRGFPSLYGPEIERIIDVFVTRSVPCRELLCYILLS
ncbi:hypothetical protein ACQJBY_016943 [Aegilops geniculata]